MLNNLKSEDVNSIIFNIKCRKRD